MSSSEIDDRSASKEDRDLNTPDESETHEGGLFGSDSEPETSKRDTARPSYDPEADKSDDSDVGSNHSQHLTADATSTTEALSVGWHRGPISHDGELYLLSFPPSIGLESKSFDVQQFESPRTEHHTSSEPALSFSAFQTSKNTIRWRVANKEVKTVQSNARINRWSDGSLTLQLATNSREQFELIAKPLAQPQIEPLKPTPTSSLSKLPMQPSMTSRFDAHTYLVAPHESTGVLRHTHHLTAALSVQSADQDDKALRVLEDELAAAAKGNRKAADGGVEVIKIDEDPENAKRRAELAEKEKNRMQRRLQATQEREEGRGINYHARAGMKGITGLTIDDLEGEESVIPARSRPTNNRAKRKSRRRNSDFSDEDDVPHGRTREDEYDEDDGFLVGSDEAEEEHANDSSAEEVEFESETGILDKSRAKISQKDEDESQGVGRNKRRRLIVEEDEDEDD